MADSEIIAVTGSTGYVGETSSALTRIRLPVVVSHVPENRSRIGHGPKM